MHSWRSHVVFPAVPGTSVPVPPSPSRAALRRYGSAFVLAAALATLLQPLPARAAEEVLSLAEALRLAIGQSSQLASHHALVSAARTGSVAAGELPDPKLIGMLENVPTSGADAWSLTRDPMTMRKIGVMQEFPGGDKQRLRAQRAEQDAAREMAMLIVHHANVERDVATAWLTRHYAEAALAMVTAQIAEAELVVATVGGAYRANRAPQGELIAAQSAVVELRNRQTETATQVKRARIALARYIGTDAERPLGAAPDLARLPSAISDLGDGDTLPEVRAAQAQEAVAATEADLARAAKSPDWGVELAYGFRGSPFANMVTLQVSVDLPLFAAKRQDPLHAAKLLELDAARAAREDAKRRQSAEVQGMLAEWEAAQVQARRIRDELIPLAAARRSAALAAYRGGTGTLTAVLDARRALLDVQLALIQQEQAAAKAWAALNFVFPVVEPA
jgi:outer membrane protein TolC